MFQIWWEMSIYYVARLQIDYLFSQWPVLATAKLKWSFFLFIHLMYVLHTNSRVYYRNPGCKVGEYSSDSLGSQSIIHTNIYTEGQSGMANPSWTMGLKPDNLEKNNKCEQTMQKSIKDRNHGSEPNPGAMS